MSSTSSNHAEILAIHEASQECIWLRSVIKHIRESSEISSGKEAPTIIHEDNKTCIAQLKDEYIKGGKTKHILLKFFFTHDLQKSGNIIVQKVYLSDNLADLFTKALPTATFKKLLHGIGTRRLNELKSKRLEFGDISPLPMTWFVALDLVKAFLHLLSLCLNCERYEDTEDCETFYACSDSLLLTPLCCDDIHDVTPRVSALAECDRLVSEPLVMEK
ncbi:hypothetical protein Tco_0701661 [Tanacetum coccineum]